MAGRKLATSEPTCLRRECGATVVPLVLGGAFFLTDGGSHRRIRWLESSLSSSIMVFLVAQLNGIRELGALVAIYALTSAAVLFAALREGGTDTRRTPPGIFGAMVGIVPWGLIAWYEIVPMVSGGSGPAGWVRILTLTVLGLFAASAVLVWHGTDDSRLRIVVSVVASAVTRSVLAWTVAAAVVGGFHLT